MSSSLKAATKDLVLEGIQDVGGALLAHFEILKDVPLIGAAIKAAQVACAVPDALFLNKVKRFALELESISVEERIKFSERMSAEPDTCRRAGENVLLLLDRLDDLDKATLLGRLFASYVRGQVSFEVFKRLGSCVDGGLTEDFYKLVTYQGAQTEDKQPYLCYLSRTALVDVSRKIMAEEASSGYHPDLGFEVTALGKLFVKILSSQPPEPSMPPEPPGF